METTQYIYIIVSVTIIDRNKIALKAFCHTHALFNCPQCLSTVQLSTVLLHCSPLFTVLPCIAANLEQCTCPFCWCVTPRSTLMHQILGLIKHLAYNPTQIHRHPITGRALDNCTYCKCTKCVSQTYKFIQIWFQIHSMPNKKM